jgi:predicted nucleic acid-binding protein
MTAVLIDTNILVYAYQTNVQDPRVQKAKIAVGGAARSGNGVVGVQNLAEFCAVCLRKIKPPVPVPVIQGNVADIQTMFRMIVPSAATVGLALDAVERHHMSFWDGMVFSIAKENGIAEILSEDFQDGRTLEGITFRNPVK